MRPKPVSLMLALLLAVGAILHSEGFAPLFVSGYSPRRAASLADPMLMWILVGSHVLIALSYAILLAGFLLLMRRLRHLPQLRTYLWGIVAFMVFMGTSEITNLLRIISVWWPIHQFSIALKFICAVSLFPAAALFASRTPALAASVQRFFNLLLTTQQQGEKLRKSEEFLDRTNRLAGAGGWEVDLRTEEVTWSTGTCNILGAPPGYKPTLAEGIDMFDPGARPIILAAVQLASSGGPGWDLELPVIRFDGRPIWARTVGKAEVKNGKPIRLSGAFQDVTAKVEVREALRLANVRIGLATDSGEIGIWDWDIVNGELTCDDWMYRLHGKESRQLQTADAFWRDHLHPEDRVRVEQALEDAMQGIKEYAAEFRIIWEDGSVHTLRGAARVTRDDQGRAMHMVGVNWDVTESRQLLSQLAEQHERLRVTLHSIGDAVLTTDAHGAVTWLNPVAERLTGWSIVDAAGRPFKEVLHTSAKVQKSLEEVSCSAPGDGIKASQNALLVAQDGTEHAIESTAAPICSHDGEHLGSVLVFRDVTEKRRLMASAEDAMKLQLKLKDEFLSNVSHELRSPLTSIYSFTSIIADDLAGDTTQQQKEYLQIILKNVAQLQSMIEDLLMVTQSRAGKLNITPEAVLPRDVIVDTFQTVRGAAAKKNIQLSLGHCADLNSVYADPMRLRQVFIILLDNAIKFTPEQGKIRVHVSRKDTEFMLIEIEDTGTGVPVEKWELIFDSMYQVIDTTHADTSQAGRTGLGLGLHIARNLIHRQGGKIWVTSVMNRGSVFRFTIPIYSGQDNTERLGAPQTVQRRRSTDAALTLERPSA